MSRVSIVLPARNELYLNKTIDDLLTKAKGEIEIIAVLDGYWPNKYIKDPRVSYIHLTNPKGMRNAINTGVALARGKYILKTDAHCMFAEGFDIELQAHCEEDWVVVPRRYPLDPVKWEIEKRTDNKYPIDYMILNENLQGIPAQSASKEPIDDLMTSQGSCWFMHKKYFNRLRLLDEDTYGTFWQEFQEIGLKCWLSGGQVKVNKNTWYAHWHKTDGRGYSLPAGEQEKTRNMITKWKMQPMFYRQIHDLNWLFERFK